MPIKNYFKEDRWKIGIVNKPLDLLFTDSGFFNSAEFIQSPEDSFLADPFWIDGCGDRTFYCEKFDFKKQLGSIVKVDITTDRIIEVTDFLCLESHLSFPFLCNFQGELVILPENSESGETSYYKLANLEDKKILFEFPAIDPVLFSYRDQQYLFCTILDGTQNSVLQLFILDCVKKKWIKHPMSPIHELANGSRMAGTIFEVEGVWYRPGQLNKTVYGSGIGIYRIDEISESLYREKLVKVITPPVEYSGIHTINRFGNKTIFDVKNEFFSISKPYSRFKKKYLNLR